MSKKEKVLIYEKYYGVVKHVGKHTTTIVYEIDDDDLVEHTYSSYQFANGFLPNKGDLIAFVTLITKLPEENKENDENIKKRTSRPGKHVSGPLEL